MKKIVSIVIAIAVVFGLSIQPASALTKWKYADWKTEYYGTATKKTDNITNLKGSEETLVESGMKKGPYSYASTQKLADTIQEETYVALNSANYENGELFEVSLALKNKAGAYVNEEVITTTKVGDHFEIITNGDAEFKAIIDKEGVYTYRWEIRVEGEKTYVNVSILLWDEEIAKTKDIDLDTLGTTDAKRPAASEEEVSVKYLWFCNIKADYGVDVYTELPPKPVVETQTVKPDNQAKENPNTYDAIILYVAIALVGSIALGYSIKKAMTK